MDIASVIGLVAGLAVMVYGMILSTKGNLRPYWDIASVFITIGGSMFATMMSFPMSQFKNVMQMTKLAFREPQHDANAVIRLLVGFAERARREGLLALEAEANQLQDPFLQKGIQLVVDGTDPELVRGIMEIEMSFIEERHKQGQAFFFTWGSMAPAFGMIGTLIGLCAMLLNLSDASALGPGMSAALITTFYGSVLANMIMNPIATKLGVRSSEEIMLKEVMVEGILSIQAGENPRIVEEKLKAFLAPKQRLTGKANVEQVGNTNVQA